MDLRASEPIGGEGKRRSLSSRFAVAAAGLVLLGGALLAGTGISNAEEKRDDVQSTVDEQSRTVKLFYLSDADLALTSICAKVVNGDEEDLVDEECHHNLSPGERRSIVFSGVPNEGNLVVREIGILIGSPQDEQTVQIPFGDVDICAVGKGDLAGNIRLETSDCTGR